MSHVASGTNRLMPAIEAAPRSDSAAARRRVNHRAMAAVATTCPVAAIPSEASTPNHRWKCQSRVAVAVASSEPDRTSAPPAMTGRMPTRSTRRPRTGMNAP